MHVATKSIWIYQLAHAHTHMIKLRAYIEAVLSKKISFLSGNSVSTKLYIRISLSCLHNLTTYIAIHGIEYLGSPASCVNLTSCRRLQGWYIQRPIL